MDIFLTVSAILCCLIGLLGCLLPVLPGPPANLLRIFLIHWTGYAQYSPEFLQGMFAAFRTVKNPNSQ